MPKPIFFNHHAHPRKHTHHAPTKLPVDKTLSGKPAKHRPKAEVPPDDLITPIVATKRHEVKKTKHAASASIPRRSQSYFYLLMMICLMGELSKAEAGRQCYWNSPSGEVGKGVDCDLDRERYGVNCLYLASVPPDSIIDFSHFDVALGHVYANSRYNLVPQFSHCFFYGQPSTDYWRYGPPPSGKTLLARSVAIYGNVELTDWTIRTSKIHPERQACFTGQGNAARQCGLAALTPSERNSYSIETGTPSETAGAVLIAYHTKLTGKRTYFQAEGTFLNWGKVTLDSTYSLHTGDLIQKPDSELKFTLEPSDPRDVEVVATGKIDNAGQIVEHRFFAPAPAPTPTPLPPPRPGDCDVCFGHTLEEINMCDESCSALMV
jgi:hypothetical protein